MGDWFHHTTQQSVSPDPQLISGCLAFQKIRVLGYQTYAVFF